MPDISFLTVSVCCSNFSKQVMPQSARSINTCLSTCKLPSPRCFSC